MIWLLELLSIYLEEQILINDYMIRSSCSAVSCANKSVIKSEIRSNQ